MLFFDRLANLVSGLGGAKDKTVGNVHVHTLRDKSELDAAYRDNPFVRKGIDIIPFDMLRAWRAWQADEKDVERIEAAETALNLRQKLIGGMVRGRLYGGGVILIGDGSSRPEDELLVESLGKDGIKFLHVLSRHEIKAGETNLDPLSPYFGEPTYYEVRSGASAQQRIHPSRVVRFLGAPLPEDTIIRENCWSDSILQSTLETVDQATSALAYIAAMLPEAKQDIISVPGLSQALSTVKGTDELTKRFSYAAQMKGMFGMLLLEGDGKSPEGELYQQKQISFTGLPEVAQLYLQVVSGAFDIPVTRMLGQSPAGMNATGDSDTRNYYDHVAAKQTVDLSPAIRRLDRMLIRHALGTEPAGVWYAWNPLYQPSEKEKADVASVKANTAKVYYDTGLVPIDVLMEGVKGALINSDTFPGIEAAYDEHGDLDPADEPETQAEKAAAGQMSGNVVPLRRKQAVADAEPRTLYVSRKVLNGPAILAWAREQGFETPLEAADLHVTIAYSRTPVDWFKAGESWSPKLEIPAGGPRQMERFGDATVLLFTVSDLRWRHREIIEAGASWDHDDYQPHITISYGDKRPLTEIEPYQGPIILGPEIFAEVDDGWKAEED